MDPNTETLADPTESGVATDPSSALGIASDSPPGEPRNQLNGLRVREPGETKVYLVDRGERREVDAATYNNLFRSWDGILSDLSVRLIPLGAPIEPGAVLARTDDSTPLYLVESKKKRWIRGPQVADRYHLAQLKAAKVPAIILDSVPDGSDINYP